MKKDSIILPSGWRRIRKGERIKRGDKYKETSNNREYWEFSCHNSIRVGSSYAPLRLNYITKKTN